MAEGNFDFKFLPNSLRERLLPFQRKGIQYAIRKHGRCLIGDEMGLGKTIQAISVAYYYRSEWPLLVVLPSSMKYPWIEELEKWLPCLQPKDINLITTSTDVSNIPKAAISLVGYGLMQSSFKTLQEALHKQNFKVIIVDESHFLKNPKAARTKTLVPLLTKAKRVLMLSGTPALARPAELYSQINCISNGQFGSWTSFAKRYCDARWKFFGRVKNGIRREGASNLPELHRKLTSSVMIRREKREVLTELPPKRRQKVPFELAESKQKKELDSLWLELSLYLNGETPSSSDGGKDAGFEIRRLSSALYISTGKAKIAAISEYVRMLLDNQEMKFLVFAHHKEILTAVVQTAQAYAREKEPTLEYIRIDGDVPPIERMKEVNRFQQDSHVRVAALSIMAAGTGLTLTAASHVVFAELHWTPGVLEQCEDRAHRIGQKNAIHVHYLVAKGTIDEWMWSTLNKKVSVLSSTLNGRIEKLNAEVLGGGVGEFLKQAVFWMPSALDQEEDDSFFFSQTPKKPESRDIRSYMKSSQPRKGRGASPKKESVTDRSSPVISLLDSDDECDETTPAKKIENPASGDIGHGVTTPGNVSTSTSSKHSSFQHGRSLLPSTSPSRSLDGLSNNSNDDIKAARSYDERAAEVKQNLTSSDVASTSSSKPLDDCYKAALSDSEYELVTGVEFSSLQKSSRGSCQETPTGDDASQSCHDTSSPGLDSDVFKASPSIVEKERSEEAGTRAGDKRNRDNLEACMDRKTSKTHWSCLACTFLNHSSLPLCEICDTPRKQKGKRSRVKTRSRVINKKLEDKETPSVTLDTLSDSVDDFETSRIGYHKPAKSGRNSQSTYQSQGHKIHLERHLPKDTLSRRQDSPVVGLNTDKILETKQTSSDGRQSKLIVSHHGIEISDSDSDGEANAVLKMDPLKMAQQSTPTNRTETKAGQSYRKSLGKIYSPSGGYSQPGLGGKHVTTPKHHRRAIVENKETPPGERVSSAASQSKKNSRLEESVSDDLFSDDENRDNDPKGETVSEVNVDKEEVEAAVSCSLSSPLNEFRSKVKPWTCTEPSCGHVNLPSDAECENCWASKPINQSTGDGCSSLRDHNKFECSQSPGFMSASEVLTNQDQSLMGVSKLKSSGSKVSSPVRGEAENMIGEVVKSQRCQSDAKQREDETQSEAESLKREESSCDVDGSAQETPKQEIFEAFLYCASKFTDRVYLYDIHQQPLNCSFQPLDLGMRDLESLPPVLHVPQNMKIVRRFLREWKCLTELKKRKLRKSGLIFDRPTAAVEALMKKQPFQLSTRRFLTKDDLADAALQKAEDVGGSLRVIHKKMKPSLPFKSPPKSDGLQFVTSPVAGKKRKKLPEEEDSEDRGEREEPKKKLRQETENIEVNNMSKYGFVQAIGADGVPLCVFCNGPVEAAGFSNTNAAWDTRYCSENCKQENQVRWKSSKYVRDQLLEAERGVCQICYVDAHSIYKNLSMCIPLVIIVHHLMDLPKSKRKDFLAQTAYADLPVKQLNEMIRSPMEGQFWHADHIIPVYKGGGLCSLENFRTLCVLCHTKVTAKQGQERKETRAEEANRKAGLRDIRKFFQDNG